MGSGGEYGQSAPRGYSAFGAPPMPAPTASKPPAPVAPAQAEMVASQAPYHAQQSYQSAAPGFQVMAMCLWWVLDCRAAPALLHAQQSCQSAAPGSEVTVSVSAAKLATCHRLVLLLASSSRAWPLPGLYAGSLQPGADVPQLLLAESHMLLPSSAAPAGDLQDPLIGGGLAVTLTVPGPPRPHKWVPAVTKQNLKVHSSR